VVKVDGNKVTLGQAIELANVVLKQQGKDLIRG
jgi:hypothetical protein